MFKKLGSYLLLSLVGLLAILSLTWVVLDRYLPAPPKKIIATTGIKNGAYEPIAKQYQAILAQSGVTLEIENSEGTGENLARLTDPKLNYQVGFASEGTLDSAQTKGIVSLGQVAYLPYWVFYRSTKEWPDLDSLKGKRIAIGPEGTGRHRFAQALHLDASTPKAESALSGAEATKALREGRVDAIIVTGAFSIPVIQELLRDPSIRLLNFPRAEALTKIFPQFRHLVLPAGIIDFENNIPPHDVNIIATTTSVLVRQDLHPQIIYLLGQALQEVHSGFGPFHTVGTFPTQYPSFINRYLPFWITNYIVRLFATLIAILGIGLPLIKILPKIYKWFIEKYVDNLMQRLRIVHIDLNSTTEPSSLNAIEAELNSIDRASHLLPMRHTNHYFSLIGRIDSERKLLDNKKAPQSEAQ
jgi:TRAP-type uncharacterized transport system substrate-binding protein